MAEKTISKQKLVYFGPGIQADDGAQMSASLEEVEDRSESRILGQLWIITDNPHFRLSDDQPSPLEKEVVCKTHSQIYKFGPAFLAGLVEQ